LNESYYDPNNTNATFTFCTIVNNSASSGDGFDITNVAYRNSQGGLASPHVEIKATIIGGNDTQGSPIADDVLTSDGYITMFSGVITSDGYNVIQHMSSANFASGSAHATDRSVTDLTGVLGPHPQLQKNGAPTPTFALFQDPHNPALNLIPPLVC